MIEISKLTDKDIGRWVEYRREYSGEIYTEIGRLKFWNDIYIFVVYDCNNEWHRFEDFTGVATKPAELFFKTQEELNMQQVIKQIIKQTLIALFCFMTVLFSGIAIINQILSQPYSTLLGTIWGGSVGWYTIPFLKFISSKKWKANRG